MYQKQKLFHRKYHENDSKLFFFFIIVAIFIKLFIYSYKKSKSLKSYLLNIKCKIKFKSVELGSVLTVP